MGPTRPTRKSARGVADSMGNGTVLAAWLYILADRAKVSTPNSYVGYVEAASGAAQLVSALPVGWVADKVGRAPVIKLGSVLFLVANVLTWFAVFETEVTTDTERSIGTTR